MVFSKSQLQLLRSINIVFEILHVFIVLFIIHNIFKYVIGLKMKRPLIWIFYILLFIAGILRIVEFSVLIVHPEQSSHYSMQFLYQISQYGTILSVFVALVLILTMHKLELAIKILQGLESLDGTKRQESIGIGIAILYGCFSLAFIIYLCILGP